MCFVFTVQLLQQGPFAHCASFFSLQVMGSQQGSSFWHSSNEPQSHSSLSSTIRLPQCRFSSSCETIINMSELFVFSKRRRRRRKGRRQNTSSPGAHTSRDGTARQPTSPSLRVTVPACLSRCQHRFASLSM